jgi:hypothetical protein
LPERNTKFLIDTNLFVAAVKSEKTKSTELLVNLIEGTWELVADDILSQNMKDTPLSLKRTAFLNSFEEGSLSLSNRKRIFSSANHTSLQDLELT